MDKQQEAIRRIKSGESLFLTGSGGVGKSWVIEQIVDNHTLLCAPSGIAALNIGGITCHRAFGLPLGVATTSDYGNVSAKVWNMFSGNGIRRIVIDEIGMVRRDYLGVINRKLQKIKGNRKLFGGIQIVVVGDFYQLEPILQWNESKYYEYDSTFAFTSPVWDFPMVELTDVKRQSNKRQVLMLNSIRKKDRHHAKALEYIQNECKEYVDSEDTLHLCCYNADADRINKKYFDKIPGEVVEYKAKYSPNWGKERPVDENLKLKISAKVIICMNDKEGMYVNGERGVVLYMEEDHVCVLKEDGIPVIVMRANWEKYGYKRRPSDENPEEEEIEKEVEGVYNQIPLRLGWAVSVHKSQGMTLDDVAIDVGRGCFSHGQLYVALSRIRDLKKISFRRPVDPSDVIVHPEVKQFYGDS